MGKNETKQFFYEQKNNDIIYNNSIFYYLMFIESAYEINPFDGNISVP